MIARVNIVIKCHRCGVYLDATQGEETDDISVRPCWGCIRDDVKEIKEDAEK